eukprot:3643791-Prymnesium_polylepis.1
MKRLSHTVAYVCHLRDVRKARGRRRVPVRPDVWDECTSRDVVYRRTRTQNQSAEKTETKAVQLYCSGY